MTRLWVMFVALSAIAGLACGVAQGSPRDVREMNDVEYCVHAGESLRANIALPPSRGIYPAIVHIPGDGWAEGDRYATYLDIRDAAENGFVGVSLSYRGAPEYPFPAQIEDVKCAIRFLRAHWRRFELDPGAIGVLGYSAGAQLALLAGASGEEEFLGEGHYAGRSSRVQAVVNYFGPTDLPRLFETANWFTVQALLGAFSGTPSGNPLLYAIGSPVNYLTHDDPPILTFNGDLDTFVPLEQAILLDEAARAAGVDHALVVIPGGGHSIFPDPYEKRARRMKYRFFRTHLQARRAVR